MHSAHMVNRARRETPMSIRSEVTIRAADLHSLFQHRDFDPLTDDPDTLWNMNQLADLTHLVGDLSRMTLLVLRCHGSRFCRRRMRFCSAPCTGITCRKSPKPGWSHGLAAIRVARVRSRPGFLHGKPARHGRHAAGSFPAGRNPHPGSRDAGHRRMGLPLDDLVQGWWPIRERERIFRAIRTMRLVVQQA